MNYLLILITVIGTVCGQIVLKYGQATLSYPKEWTFKQILLVGSHNLLNIYFIAALLLALLAAIAWSLVIQQFNLSYAYPFTALSYILIHLISLYCFKEQANLYQLLGVILITAGIVLVGIKK